MTTKGSIWRKWDLHLHTPATKLSDNFKIKGKEEDEIWEQYCQIIENSDVSVFGITDYFCCENYFRFISLFQSKFPNSTKVFFPNIEFRLPVSVNRKGEEVNIHIIFDNQVSKSKIDEFLLSLKTHVTDEDGAKVKCKNLREEDFSSATVTLEEIKQCLTDLFGKSKPYITVAAANNAGLRSTNSPRKSSITDEIDKDCDAFFGGSQNVEYFLKTNRYQEEGRYSAPKSVLSGCDAHSFEDLNTKLGKKLLDTQDGSIVICDNTWIKSDCTFEGLKQVIYEPDYRVLIQENEPRCSNRKIDYIKFDFPNNVKISRIDSSDIQEFCLKNLSHKIYFSDYFTCLVGGRGTGKSTIINLIGEKLGERTDFFRSNSISIDNRPYDVVKDEFDLIEVSGTNEIEFVSQGKIEQLAEGDKLTSLVFNERIKSLDSTFESLDKDIEVIIEEINSNIRVIEDLNNKSKALTSKNHERETNQMVIDSVNDEEYKAITQAIGEIKNETNRLNDSKNIYSELLKDIRLLASKYKPNVNTDEYAVRYNEIVSNITSIEEIQQVDGQTTILEKNYDAFNEKISKLNKKFESENSKLKEFFDKRGTSEDVIKDSQNANERNARLIQEIKNAESDINLLVTTIRINEASISTYKSKSDSYSSLINSNLDIINNRLDIKNDNLLKIHFEMFFDDDAFKGNVFEEFYSYFSRYHIPGTSKSDVKRALLEIDPSEILAYEQSKFKEEFETKIGLIFNRSANYIKILDNIFKEGANFEIYKLIVTKHKYNIPVYTKFKGFYGGKNLQSCSFGQRCTAVVVTLLMTGIKPLIIDEPEAHLDNKLIAEYLIELIKTKKPDRQMIFATHNSNFVINGDSELIHVLEIPHNDIFTNVTSTTIENTSHREKLLRLEGGREAFRTRENKYNL